jgi:hypothetical protein
MVLCFQHIRNDLNVALPCCRGRVDSLPDPELPVHRLDRGNFRTGASVLAADGPGRDTVGGGSALGKFKNPGAGRWPSAADAVEPVSSSSSVAITSGINESPKGARDSLAKAKGIEMGSKMPCSTRTLPTSSPMGTSTARMETRFAFVNLLAASSPLMPAPVLMFASCSYTG